MSEERGDARESAGTTITLGDSVGEHAGLTGVWRVEIFDADGVLQWDETLNNLVTTQGKNAMLSVYTGGTFAALYASGFTGATSPSAAATYAVPVVTEMTPSQMANRPVLAWGAASGGSIIATAAMNIIANTTITGIMAMSGGAGITTTGNTGATGGVLLSEGALGTAQVISTTGTVNLSYTLSV
jgi:hypothetical protein